VRLVAAAVLAALALAGCDDTTSSAGLACDAPPGDHRVGDALVHVPPRAATDRFGVLLVAHPAQQTGPGFARALGLSPAADRAGVLVLYPTSRRAGFWQLNHRAGDADVAGVRDLLDEAGRRFCADQRRVAVAGFSNGGGFAARLACELSARVSAAVSVAGSYRALDPCAARRPVSFLEIHGTADKVVPYARGVLAYVRGWAARDGCDATPARTAARNGVLHLRWGGCDGGAAVEHVRLAGTGHAWPPSATRELFRFLRERGIGGAG
jgi:polyhydroxybutyrate depolymerase